jgi:hypothetical protein
MAPICTFILLLSAGMMKNFGIKILDMNRQANEDPNEPYSRYNMLEKVGPGDFRLSESCPKGANSINN